MSTIVAGVFANLSMELAIAVENCPACHGGTKYWTTQRLCTTSPQNNFVSTIYETIRLAVHDISGTANACHGVLPIDSARVTPRGSVISTGHPKTPS